MSSSPITTPLTDILQGQIWALFNVRTQHYLYGNFEWGPEFSQAKYFASQSMAAACYTILPEKHLSHIALVGFLCQPCAVVSPNGSPTPHAHEEIKAGLAQDLANDLQEALVKPMSPRSVSRIKKI